MRFEEVELWEIMLPSHIEYSVWYEHIQPLLIDGGLIFYNDNLKGYWKSVSEHSRVFRIAATEDSIKKICELTALRFKEECVMAYRVSNKCLMGYTDGAN